MPSQLVRYSVIIPIFNEQQRLADCLQQVNSYLQSRANPQEYQVIFVDDGSTDQSVQILQASTIPHQLIRQAQNEGKGWAVRAGMLSATGQYRAFLDADMATPIAQIDKLFHHLEQGADVAIGSRITAEGVDLRLVGRKPQPWTRRFLGKLFRLLATKPFLGNIRDSQCGAKAFTATAADSLFSQQTIKRWSFDIEILFLAKKKHLQVVEVPVDWSAQDNSKLQPSLSLAWNIIRELITIAWIHR